MAKQTINQGTAPTGAGGDTFRTGSAKLQANDDELYNQLGANAQGVLPAALPVNKGGTGATTAAAARTNLGLGTAATATLTTSRDDATTGRILRVGDFGLGVLQSIITTDKNLNDLSSGAYNIATSAANSPGAGWLQSQNWTNNETFLIKQVWTAAYSADMRIRQKTTSGGDWSGWKKVWTQDSTTVDANGFIKAASPIIQLFANKIEMNDEAQQQNIEFEKLGIGDYLIKGSSGFAQDGWYIETPKDANGNLLVAVVYEQLANGDISVKTYDYMLNKKGRIIADIETPLDIPEGRWIDLRLQELPQPEIKIPEPIAPPEFKPTGLAEAVATVMESYHDPEQ